VKAPITGLVWDGGTATGAKGHYTVRWASASGPWWLTAVGHDGLPLMEIPATGRRFWTPDEAKAFADNIDRQPPVGEMSGS